MKYAAKKLLMLLITMVIVSFLAFAAFELISGSAADTMLGTEGTPEQIAALEEKLGLNRPFLVRYFEWLGGFFTGNLGNSFRYRQPVAQLLAPKIGVTLCLSLMSFLLILVVSIPLGLFSARYNRGIKDGIWSGLIQFMMAIPPFFTGVMLTWVFSIILRFYNHGQFPGLGNDFWGSVAYLVYPAVAISIPRIAMTMRMLRSRIQNEMTSGYVRTAISRGNDRKQVLRGHVLKNSLVPVVTFLAQTMAEIVAASVVVEQVFAIPGLGRLLVSSIGDRDFPVVQALVVILAFWVVLAGTLADIINQRIDPRLRLGGGAK